MKIHILDNKNLLGRDAAVLGSRLIRQAIKQNGRASIVVATGASQFEMIEALVMAPRIDWTRVTAFHLDEYVGMPITHRASFRKYLWERFVSRLPLPLAAFHYHDGEEDAEAECRRVGALISKHSIDVCFAGIGENGHLAFNDPPADFSTKAPYLVVNLDEECRKQQLGEGWFKTLAQVPRQAISMSVAQIMKSRAVICSVPDRRKALAVKNCLQGDVSPMHPSSILQNHPAASFFLDGESSSLLGSALGIVGKGSNPRVRETARPGESSSICRLHGNHEVLTLGENHHLDFCVLRHRAGPGDLEKIGDFGSGVPDAPMRRNR